MSVIGNAVLTAAGNANDEITRLEDLTSNLQDTMIAQSAMIAQLQARIAELESGSDEPEIDILFGANSNGLALIDKLINSAQRGPYFGPNTLTGSAPVFGSKANTKGAYDKGIRVFSVSYKDRGLTAQRNLETYLRSFPDDVEILLTYFHEHDGNIRDGDLTIESYQQGCREARQVADVVGCKFGPIHNGVNRHHINDPWGIYPDIWEANDPEVDIDFWGTDMYAKKYESPENIFGPCLEYAKNLGLPLVIGETASFSGSNQALWAKSVKDWFTTQKYPSTVMWWSDLHGTEDYRMNADTVTAWFDV